MKLIIFLTTTIAAIAIPIFSQAPAETKPAFEVTSVKPSMATDSYVSGTPGGRYVAVGVSLRLVITDAFRIRGFQLIGGPAWLNEDRWDIEGRPKAEDAAQAPQPGALRDPSRPSTGNLMVQSLLEERFQLKTHRETKELPIYELTVAKGGLKVKASGGVPEGRPRMRMGRGTLEAYQTPLANLTFFLSQEVGRTIVDKTNDAGLYDMNMKWSPVLPTEGAPPADLPSIFTALQEQLGLKLESARGPIEIVVIDSVERPTAN
jgi:uncharacterized protein (TIGR03435 family)